MGVCDRSLVNRFRGRVMDQLPTATGAYPLVLLLNIFARHGDKEMTTILLSEILKHKATLTPQGFAMPLIDVLYNFSKDEEMAAALTPLFLEALNNLESMDLRSLVQIYNALGKSVFPSKSHYLDFLANYINKHIERATLHQISLILSASAKSSHIENELLEKSLQNLEKQYHEGDKQQLLFLFSSLLKLGLKDHTLTRNILCRITSNTLDGPQFSNLAYCIGKHEVDDPPVSYLKETFEKLETILSFRELGLAAYGFHKMGEKSLDPRILKLALEMLESDPSLYDTISYEMLKYALNIGMK